MNQKSHELAWAAGFYDGEGSSGCYDNGKGSCHPVLQISQKYVQPLVRWRNAIKRGKIKGPYVNHGDKTIYSLRINKRGEIYDAYIAMFPYLGPRKRRQLEKTMYCAKHKEKNESVPTT